MIIVITWPTGVGKTKLSIMLAKKYNAEIINGDSVQIYKGLDIGSSKIKEDEKEGIVHHLLDYKEVSEDYSLYEYQKDARKLIEDITKRGKRSEERRVKMLLLLVELDYILKVYYMIIS